MGCGGVVGSGLGREWGGGREEWELGHVMQITLKYFHSTSPFLPLPSATFPCLLFTYDAIVQVPFEALHF